MGCKTTPSIFEADPTAPTPRPPRTGDGQAPKGALPSPNRGALHTQRSPTYISGNQRFIGASYPQRSLSYISGPFMRVTPLPYPADWFRQACYRRSRF
jgi:hypothetical protein